MMKSITNLNENLEVYIESGTARLRFKEEGAFKALLKEKLAELNIDLPRNIFASDSNEGRCFLEGRSITLTK